MGRGKSMHELAMRDPAAAAIFGDMDADFGSDPYGPTGPYSPYGGYGTESGGSHNNAVHPDPAFAGYGDPYSFGFEFAADDPSAAVSVAHPAHPLHTDNPRLQAIVSQHLSEQRATQGRVRLLEPNGGSRVKVERYRFALNQNVNIGTAANFTVSGAPDFNLRPQRISTNVNVPGFILISEGKVANVSFTSGGSIDAWELNANAVDQMVDTPTLSPANKATIIMASTSLVPSGFTNASVFTFVISFTGWATIAA